MQMSRIVKGMEAMMKDIIMECSKKYNFDGEEAIREVLGMNEKVMKEKVVKEKRGRPKKAAMEVESNAPVDLFAEMNQPLRNDEPNAVDELASLMGAMEVAEPAEAERELAMKQKKEERELAMKQKKEAEKAEREAKREAEKAEREAKKEAENAERELAKQKKEAEKAERELAKQKKAEEKTQKEATKKPKKAADAPVAPVAPVAPAEPANQEGSKGNPGSPSKITVTRFEHEGVKYLKTLENILYDPHTKNEVGLWCEESQTIKELPQEDEEELEEEEYESESE
jgi:flagellar biosynthesis GTPase FlhF